MGDARAGRGAANPFGKAGSWQHPSEQSPCHVGCQGSQAGGQPGQARWAQPAFNRVCILYTPRLVFSIFILHLLPRNCELRATRPGDLLVGGVVLKSLTLWFYLRLVSWWLLCPGLSAGSCWSWHQGRRGASVHHGLRLPAKRGVHGALRMSTGWGRLEVASPTVTYHTWEKVEIHVRVYLYTHTCDIWTGSLWVLPQMLPFSSGTGHEIHGISKFFPCGSLVFTSGSVHSVNEAVIRQS